MKQGFLGKVYYGAAGSTAGTEWKRVRDITVQDERNEADASDRGSDIELVETIMRTMAWEWEAKAQTADAGFTFFRTAYNANTPIAVKIIDEEGYGFDLDCKIIRFGTNLPLREGQMIPVRVRPYYGTRYPAPVAP